MMGVPVDFYVQKAEGLEWLGSIDWVGSPRGLVYKMICVATTEDQYRNEIANEFEKVSKFKVSGFEKSSVTLPNQPWPWDWKNSYGTDNVYVWNGTATQVYCWGCPIKYNAKWEVIGYGECISVDAKFFPDMK